MAILMGAADLANKLAPELRVNETVAQFASNFFMQLDFRDEAENLRRFSSNFGSAFWRAIVSFPQPIEGGRFPLVSQHLGGGIVTSRLGGRYVSRSHYLDRPAEYAGI